MSAKRLGKRGGEPRMLVTEAELERGRAFQRAVIAFLAT